MARKNAYEFFKSGLPPGIERYFDSVNGDLICSRCKTPIVVHTNEWGMHSNPEGIKHYCKATGFVFDFSSNRTIDEQYTEHVSTVRRPRMFGE